MSSWRQQQRAQSARRALCDAWARRERKHLYALGWSPSRAERSFQDSETMMQRSQEQLSRILPLELQDALWESRGRAWQRRGVLRGAVVAGAFESVQCFLEEINTGRVNGVGVWSAVGVVSGVFVWRMRGMRVDESSVELFAKRDVLWLLMLGNGAGIIKQRWRELSCIALGEYALQNVVQDATTNLTNRERTLMLRMAEDFHGNLGELVDAVQALS